MPHVRRQRTRGTGVVSVVGFHEAENTLCVRRPKQATNNATPSLQFQTIDSPLLNDRIVNK